MSDLHYCSLYFINCFSVLEVNVVDVNAEKIEDVVFPKTGLAQAAQGTSWLDSGNSIRLSGNSLRSLGVDGKTVLPYCWLDQTV